MLIVTTDQMPGFEILRIFGEASGSAVRADSSPGANPSQSSGTFRVGERPEPGGSVPAGLGELRREAVQRLGEAARRMGANAVLGLRYETAQIGPGHEVCAYGTAVWSEVASRGDRAPASQDSRSMPPYGPDQQAGAPPMVGRNLTMGLHGELPR